MIDLEKKAIRIGNREHTITSFEVWFRIPTGLTSSLDLAIQRCQELDFDPRVCIVATPVAIVNDLIYEELVRM